MLGPDLPAAGATHAAVATVLAGKPKGYNTNITEEREPHTQFGISCTERYIYIHMCFFLEHGNLC